ncbi:MAG: amino acid aminotransferase [Chloroflexota bacterium]|tara:strand:- start:559 stop:1761 length:1203 start_codon:yes stop_codon:yes gene_type:complete
MLFDKIKKAEKDPILGLTEEFKKDDNVNKVNLSVGVYQDEFGNTPTFSTVLDAERQIQIQEISKTYKPIDGDKQFIDRSIGLVFGGQLSTEKEGLLFGLNTPGGTGALRLASDFLHKFSNESSVWISDPSWPNHKPIFESSGFNVNNYSYFDSSTNSVGFDDMVSDIKSVPSGDIIVLHGCCHNPTGSDLNYNQWEEIADLIANKGLVTICDFAYQGLGDGIDEDARGVRVLSEKLDELIVCSSYSKNFGLYSERVGCLFYHSRNKSISESVLSQLKKTARSNYSNPPAHGSEIVKLILGDKVLRKEWIEELTQVRERIISVRKMFVEKLNERKSVKDFNFIQAQKGMFSFTGLTPPQVDLLKRDYSIYIVNSGRINIAGINSNNVDYLADSIADSIKKI